MAFKNKEDFFLLLFFFKMEENSSRFRREKVCFLCKVVYSSIIENLFENRSHGRLHCREKDNQITLNEQSFSFCVKGKVRILVFFGNMVEKTSYTVCTCTLFETLQSDKWGNTLCIYAYYSRPTFKT